MTSRRKRETTYAFIDASNIIYGTRDEGWKVDFKKLFKYLNTRYQCKHIFYFAGKSEKDKKQAKFYKKLEKFGFKLVLKPVKIYKQPDGKKVRKANCDVDLTFYAMRDKALFDRGVFLTGDGDFEILLRYLESESKKLIVIGNAKRTAKELKRLQRVQFNDLGSLREILQKK